MDTIKEDTNLLSNWIFGYQISQAIFVAAKLNLADLLETKPLSYEVLSKAANCHPDALYRLLRALASVGIFKEVDQGVFDHTNLSRLLMTHHQNSIHTVAMMYGNEQYRAWADLLSSIKTGRDAFSQVYEEKFFSYLELHPESFKIFNQYINKHAAKRIEAILASYDFSNPTNVIDLGGGDGQLLIKLLYKYSHLHGIVFDTEEVINTSSKKNDITGLHNRIKFIAGNFFQNVPPSGDIYLLSHIIHNWDDEHATLILKNCRQQINKSGKLLLIEHIIKMGNESDYGKWMDLHMLVILNGRERTQEEYAKLLGAAKFKLNNIIPTSANVSIIEAVPI